MPANGGIDQACVLAGAVFHPRARILPFGTYNRDFIKRGLGTEPPGQIRDGNHGLRHQRMAMGISFFDLGIQGFVTRRLQQFDHFVQVNVEMARLHEQRTQRVAPAP